jgi:Putative zinc-finger
MNKRAHPNRQDLLLYVDGELSPRKAAAVKAHLEACWACRLKVDQLQNTILSFTEYCGSVLNPTAPRPPRGWRTFNPKLRGIAEQSGRPSLLSWLHVFLSERRISWSITATVTVAACLLLLILRLQQAPPVSAGQLLARAAESRSQRLREVIQPVIYQKLRIRTDGKTTTREIWLDTFNDRLKDTWRQPRHAPESNISAAGETQDGSTVLDLPTLFAANHLKWEEPLSAVSYSQWWASLSEKAEEVISENNRLTLRTTSNGPYRRGSVVEASLTVRTSDFHPVVERLRIRGTASDHEVELLEMDYQVVPLAVVTASLFTETAPSETPAELASPARAPVARRLGPTLADLSDAEMAVRYALHQAQADLGEPIEVRIAQAERPAAVKVGGLVPSVERKQELVAMLIKIPHVDVDLRTEAEVAATPAPSRPASGETPPATTVVSPESPIAKQLLEYLGDQAAMEAFSRRAFAATQALMAEAWALRRLEERYPLTEQERLSATSRQLLETMIRDHRRTLREVIAEAQAVLEPVLIKIAGAKSEPVPSVPPTASLFDAAQQVERLTLGLLSGSDLPSSAERSARDLLAALQALKMQLEER